MRKKDQAVVELISTYLLLALTVIFFTAISYFLLSAPQAQPGAIVTIEAKIVNNNLILEHRGGEAIGLNAAIRLIFKNKQVQIRAYDYIDNESQADGMWGFGEQVIYPIYKNYDDDFAIDLIDIMIINKDTQSSIMYGSTVVEPSSDLSIRVTVDQEFPMIGSPIVFTITLRNNGNINVTDATIRFELPDGFIFCSYNASSGTYDNSTGIWRDIHTIQPDQSAVLNVTSIVKQVIPSEITQFLILLDGSGSIQKKDLDKIRQGFVSAVGNSSIFPRTGVGELTLVEFGGNAGKLAAKVVLYPTVINNETIGSVLTILNSTQTMPGLASTACGFLLGSDTVSASGNFTTSNRHVVLLITDGKASLICNIDGDYLPDSPSGNDALISAVQARDYLIDEFGMDTMGDEIDVIAVRVTDVSAYKWFKNDIVWPQPGYYAPPFHKGFPLQGFVCNASSWDQFPAIFQNVLTNILYRVKITGSIVQISVNDPKIVNNIDSIIIIPQIM